MPASQRSSASSTSAGAERRGRAATCSMRTVWVEASTSSSAAARLAATSRLASSAISATRSRAWTARQTLMALRAPAASSGENDPKTAAVGILWSGSSDPVFPRFDDKGRHLTAARRHVGQPRRAEACEESRHASAEHIRREIHQHVAFDDGARFTHRKALPPNVDAFLDDPSALRLPYSPGDGSVPLAFAGFPAEGDAGAAILVVRLEDKAVPVAADVLGAVFAHQSRPRHVRSDDLEIGAIEQMVVSLVGQDRKEGLLVRNLAAERIR